MFTIEQIKAAHAKTKSGADFPRYVQDLIGLGVKSYEHYVADGHIQYYGDHDFTLTAAAKWEPVPVAAQADEAQLKHALSIHQQGQTDYLTFCKTAAAAGVELWTLDMDQMTCSYYDKSGKEILVEQVPVP